MSHFAIFHSFNNLFCIYFRKCAKGKIGQVSLRFMSTQKKYRKIDKLSKSILRDLILIKFQRCSLFHCLSSYNSIKEISEREPFRIESIKYKINLETMNWQNDWFLVFIEEGKK